MSFCQNGYLSGFSRIGGKSADLSCFCISTFLTKMVGEVAVTGTPPESAPQVPVNTWDSPPACIMLENIDSGVPIRSTPLTRRSGRPSTYFTLE